MKICILFNASNGPLGGGNQFLKALRTEFIKRGVYTDNHNDANIFLYNSFQDLPLVLKTKLKYKQKSFIHRIDGPISSYRNSNRKMVDKIIFKFNSFSDATIFQSKYSEKENKKMGLDKNIIEKIIYNAPDKSIFFQKENHNLTPKNKKIELISTSWSSNIMKGFEDYAYLDENLNFSKFKYTFIGNSPITFKNIELLPPLTSNEIAEKLRSSDIYITASKKDPCSNSLIEALSCGLPAIALNDGGHPELVRDGGVIFNDPSEIPGILNRITKNYNELTKSIPTFDIEDTAKQYIDVFNDVIKFKKNNPENIKKFSLLNYIYLYLYLFLFRLNELIFNKLSIKK